jgi:hypothetical protein
MLNKDKSTPVFNSRMCRHKLHANPWIREVAMDKDGAWHGYGIAHNRWCQWRGLFVFLYQDTPSDKWRETRTPYQPMEQNSSEKG